MAVVVEYDHIVKSRATEQRLVLLHGRADKPFVAIDVELFVCLGHPRGIDIVKAADHGAPRISGAVTLAQRLEPLNRVFGDVAQMLLQLGYPVAVAGYEAVGLVGREFEYSLHAYLHQAQQVVVGGRTRQAGGKRLQASAYMLQHGVHILPLLELAVLVDALLDKPSLKRGEEKELHLLAQADLQLVAKQLTCTRGAVAHQFAYGEEARLVVADHTAVGRYSHLTVGKGIEGVDGLVGGGAGEEVHENHRRFGGVVVDLAYFYLPLFKGLQY